MLKAGLFEEFKGATTLLLWGDEDGMATLLAGLSALRDSQKDEMLISGTNTLLTVCSESDQTDRSVLREEESGFRWECSHDVIELAADLVQPLLRGAGYQFLDVNGLAEQVIIARDEYPADLR